MTKTKVGAPREKRSTHNLSAPHFTTSDLFKIQPVFCREVAKADNFDISMAQINRVDALPYSSFVEIDNKHHWFYVKMSQIWKPWDSFRSKAPYVFPSQLSPANLNSYTPSEVPYFTLYELFSLFVGDVLTPGGVRFRLTSTLWNNTTHVYPNPTQSDLNAVKQMYKNHECDFIFVMSGSPDRVGYTYSSGQTCWLAALRLNSAGRYLFGLINSLGYRVPRIIVEDVLSTDPCYNDIVSIIGKVNGYPTPASGTVPSTTMTQFKVSALPLIAYLSILMNYYVPTKWRNYEFINTLSYLPNPIPHVTGWSGASGGNVGLNDTSWSHLRYYILELIAAVYYGSDYFTDSLEQPYGVVNDLGSLRDPANTGTSFGLSMRQNGTDNVPILEHDTKNNTVVLSEYLLAALKAVSSKSQIRALTKNNVVGSMLQQFGIKPESADMKPYLLSQHNDQIIVEPLVSQAQTSFSDSQGQSRTMPLGFKAGEGSGTVRLHVNFDFDDPGYLICVNSISPEISLADGLNREMFHITSEEFLDPMLVNLGYQPIANAELTVSPDNTLVGVDWKLEKVFGFQNKYAEYGYPKYSYGGDFCINSVNDTLDSFHFIRKFDGVAPGGLVNDQVFALAKIAVAATSDFTTFISQFDRVFDVDDPNYDHIQQWTYFKVKAERSIPANGEFTVGDDDARVVEGPGVTDNINV